MLQSHFVWQERLHVLKNFMEVTLKYISIQIIILHPQTIVQNVLGFMVSKAGSLVAQPSCATDVFI